MHKLEIYKKKKREKCKDEKYFSKDLKKIARKIKESDDKFEHLISMCLFPLLLFATHVSNSFSERKKFVGDFINEFRQWRVGRG